MLSCKNISCRRSGKTVFKDVGFTLSPGSALILRGPNGSGKTSLLKILAGIMRPDTGQVEYDGNDIKNIYQIYSGMIEFIGHKNGMKGDFTVEQNLDFWADMADSLEAVAPAIMYFNLIECYDTKYRYLSEGQKRRVALAKLLCCPTTSIWLLDEPTNNLDKESVTALTNVINTKIDQQGIVVLSTHYDIKIKNSQELDLAIYAEED